MKTIFYNSALSLVLTGFLSFAFPFNILLAQSCPGLGSLSLNVVALPKPTLIAPIKICPDGSDTVSVAQNFSSYEWNTGDIGQNIAISGPGTFSVTVTNAVGCTGTASILVPLAIFPEPIISATTDTCKAQVILDAGSSFTAFSWSNGSTTKAVTVNNSSTYTVTVTNTFGCTASISQTVNVPPLLQLNLLGDTSFCTGTTTNLIALAPGAIAYLWSSGQSAASIPITTGGTYSVTATNQFGCSVSDSLKVTESGLIQPVIIGPVFICATTSTTISVANNFSAYAWSSGSDTASTMVNTSGIYTVTVTDANGCTGSSTHTLIGSASPNPVINAAPYTCNSLLFLDAGTGFASYHWSSGESGTSITIDSSGAYTITVTNAQGCSGTNSYVGNIPALPSVAITGLDSICPGSGTILSASTGFNQYTWTDGSNNSSLGVNTVGIYAVTVTDQFGCTVSNSFTVGGFSAPSPSIVGIAQICSTGNASFSVTGNFASYSWNNGETSSGIMTNIAGTYTVIVTSANGCTGTDTHSLTVATNLKPQIQESPYACNGLLSLDAGTGFSIYSWSNGQSTQSIIATNTGSYTVTVGDGNGCTGTDFAIVSIPTPPIVDILGSTLLCSGSTIDLNLNQIFSQYVWNTGAITPSISIAAGNTYTVTVTDNFGCTGTDVISVQEMLVPSPSVSILPYLCDGQLVLNTDAGFSFYNWTGPNGFIASSQQAIVTTSGGYSVVVTDANGCTGNATIVAIIPIQHNVSLSGPTLFCAGGMIDLAASSGFVDYTWNNGLVQQNITVGTAGLYTVTATDALGCTSTATITLGLFQQQTPVISGPTTVCLGNSATLSLDNTFQSIQWSSGATGTSITIIPPFTASVTVTDANGCTGSASSTVTVSNPPSPIVSALPYNCDNQIILHVDAGLLYAWVGPNGYNSNIQQPSVTNSGTYTVTVTDANGCSGTASIQVSVPATPMLSVVGFSPICPGQTADLTASGGFIAYHWSNGQSSASISVSQVNTYMVTATDNEGCTVSVSFTVEPAPQLSPTINGNTMICPGDFSIFEVPDNFAAYFWSNGASTASITVSQMGVYTVTVTDALGCSGSSTLSLGLANVPAPSIIVQAYQCNHQITLDAESGFTQYDWSNGIFTQSLLTTQSGTYTVTVTNALGCTGSATIQAVIPTNPVAQIAGASSLCEGNSTTLTATGNSLSYLWSNGIGGTTINISQAGAYTVTATDAYGCTAIETHIVSIVLPVATTANQSTCRIDEVGTQIQTFTAANGCDSVLTIVTSYEPNKPGMTLEVESQIEAIIGQQIQINVGANFPIDSVSFQSPFSLSCINCIDPIMTAIEPGFILVEAYDPDGCHALAEIRIIVSRKINIYVPTVFHPGSAENGFFNVFSGPEIKAIQNFHVFDRWGNELFSRDDMPTNDPGAGWDGSFRNQKMQPGVYVYYFEVLVADGSKIKYSGDVTLLE